ncbi:hypothetical protein LX32DRAFT_705555 [Colletotrichum zoysiae]|uniref:Uncharacterized protein n=1 Tax=Colletotrichum zoysiae TaxID=1216348 RepID=A0AAD9H9R9_9PEZI|nr:hypothetical protein LX32DRAFT_705555 [Colletotrichum zoysiae]
MKGVVQLLAGYGLCIQATAAIRLAHQPSVTVTNHVILAARQTEGPKTDRRWIGVDPNYIAVTVATTTKKGGETAVATITKGVVAEKNGSGGLRVLLSPAVKSKLEAIAKQVPPCGGKRRRQNLKRQGGPSCGLADFVQRVGADAELQGSFAEPLTDQVWGQIDEGYESDDPTADGGWEGDGGNHAAGEDEGYFSDDDEGFFEGAEEGEVETIVFSSEEEAVAIGAALSGGEAAANVAVWGGSTVTAGSFLAWVWGHVSNGKEIPNAHEIPSQSIHRVTKTKTSSTTTTTSSASCPTGTPVSVVNWVCSEASVPTRVIMDLTGNSKGCTCDHEVRDATTIFDVNFNQAILGAIEDLSKTRQQPKVDCPGKTSYVPSEFFVSKTSTNFCGEVMKNLTQEVTDNGVAYDIDGNQVPILKLAQVMGELGASKRSLFGRAPPEKSNSYRDYKFYMSYIPMYRECLVPKEDLCKNAYERLVRSPCKCGTNHGSAGNRMYTDASIDVGCGKFTWRVEKPEEEKPLSKPTLGNRECHDRHSHSDVHDNWFAAGKTIKAGDKEIYWHPAGYVTDYHQNYKISWIDGCRTSASEQKVDFPIEGDEGVTCENLMRANYVSCDNGGAGCSITAGCLKYDFYAAN